MARPTAGEAATNAAKDVIEPPAGVTKRIKDAIVACELPRQPSLPSPTHHHHHHHHHKRALTTREKKKLVCESKQPTHTIRRKNNDAFYACHTLTHSLTHSLTLSHTHTRAVVPCAGFWECEEHLADMFGLNDSKYQWAVDRFFEEKKEKADR